MRGMRAALAVAVASLVACGPETYYVPRERFDDVRAIYPPQRGRYLVPAWRSDGTPVWLHADALMIRTARDLGGDTVEVEAKGERTLAVAGGAFAAVGFTALVYALAGTLTPESARRAQHGTADGERRTEAALWSTFATAFLPAGGAMTLGGFLRHPAEVRKPSPRRWTPYVVPRP